MNKWMWMIVLQFMLCVCGGSDEGNVQETVVWAKSLSSQDFSYADLSNTEFFFCSGAGGWWTEMHIHEDGSFDGYYVDSNWGITGEEHPNGQVSYSEFYGIFTEPTQVDDYTYQVKIDSIEYPKGKGSEIIDGVLYDYGPAYGLQGGENFYISKLIFIKILQTSHGLYIKCPYVSCMLRVLTYKEINCDRRTIL